MMKLQSAVIDRIVDDTWVILLIGPEEIELTVPRNAIDLDVAPGMWLLVSLRDDRLVHAEIDENKTEATKQRVVSKMDLLRQRGRRP